MALSEQYTSRYAAGTYDEKEVLRNTSTAWDFLKDEHNPNRPTRKQKKMLHQWAEAEPPLIDVNATKTDMNGNEKRLFEVVCLTGLQPLVMPMHRAGGEVSESLFLKLTAPSEPKVFVDVLENRLCVPANFSEFMMKAIDKAKRPDLLKIWLDEHQERLALDENKKTLGKAIESAVKYPDGDNALLATLLHHPTVQQAVASDKAILGPALVRASEKNNTQAMERLLALGVNPSFLIEGKYGALYYAARHFDETAYRMLRDAGACIPIPFENDNCMSVLKGLFNGILENGSRPISVETMRMMLRDALEHGDTPRLATDNHGNGLLHRASQTSNKEILLMLIQEGFDLEYQNHDGEAFYVKDNQQLEQELEIYLQHFSDYHNLLEDFKRDNPFISGRELSDKCLSDSPLALLNAFAAIGELATAFQPQYWAENPALRAEMMALIYPYQHKEVLDDYLKACLNVREVEKPVKNWSASVSDGVSSGWAR